MNIKVARTEGYPDTSLKIIDEDTKEIIGNCKYNVSGNKGYIFSTYLFPEYRRKGILKQLIEDILCDIRCMGADTVYLDTLDNDAQNAWQKLGFHKTTGRNMEMNVSKKKCDCKCGLHKFKNEITIDELLSLKYKE